MLTSDEHAHISDLARANGCTLSVEVKRRLAASYAVSNSGDLLRGPEELGRALLTSKGWKEFREPRYGGAPVMLPPGASPPGAFVVEGTEVPPVVASQAFEKFLMGLFSGVDIPVEWRDHVRRRVFDVLKEIAPRERGGKWGPREEKRPRPRMVRGA